MREKIIILCIGLFFLSHWAIAADTLILSEPNTEYFRYHIQNKYLEIFEDTSGKIKINELDSLIFISAASDANDKKRTGTYWVRLKIKNNSAPDIRWMIFQGDPHVGDFEFYAPDDKGKYYLYNKGGSELSFGTRKYMSNSIASELPIDSGQVKTFYFKFNSNIEFSYKLIAQTANFYTYYSLSEYFSLGLYYGVILIMAIYNLFIYFSVRDRIYIFYVLYAISTAIFNTANDTMGFQFLWPDVPQLNYYIFYFSHLLLMVFVFLYSNAFLALKEQLPSYYKLIASLIGLYVIQFLFEFYILKTSTFYFTFLIPFLLIFIVAIKILKQGYKPAKFFLVGFSAVLLGLLLFVLMERGIVKSNIYTVYAFNVGLLIEVVVLSRATGERFRFLKKEKETADKKIIEQLTENEKLKDKVNRELEEKVKERTIELNRANDEIKRMNSLLKEDNEKLQYDIKELARARVMLRGVKFEEFCRIYPTDDSCHKFLATMKWRMGFKCKKCNNTKSAEGKTIHSKRCTRCNYDESPILYTIFSRAKFPLTKAFYMLFLFVESKEKLTSTHMSRILKLRQKTCWSFLQKIKDSSEAKKAKSGSQSDTWTDYILED